LADLGDLPGDLAGDFLADLGDLPGDLAGELPGDFLADFGDFPGDSAGDLPGDFFQTSFATGVIGDCAFNDFVGVFPLGTLVGDFSVLDLLGDLAGETAFGDFTGVDLGDFLGDLAGVRRGDLTGLSSRIASDLTTATDCLRNNPPFGVALIAGIDLLGTAAPLRIGVLGGRPLSNCSGLKFGPNDTLLRLFDGINASSSSLRFCPRSLVGVLGLGVVFFGEDISFTSVAGIEDRLIFPIADFSGVDTIFFGTVPGADFLRDADFVEVSRLSISLDVVFSTGVDFLDVGVAFRADLGVLGVTLVFGDRGLLGVIADFFAITLVGDGVAAL